MELSRNSGSRNRYADRLRLCLLSWMADPLRPLRVARLRIGRSGSCSRSLALHPQAARSVAPEFTFSRRHVDTLYSFLLTPERSHTQVEEHDNDNRGRPERPMVRSVHIAQSRPPQNRAEDQHRQKKEDTDDFKPYLSAHALKRPQKPADASRHSTRSLSGDSSARCGIRGSGCRVFRLSARCLARRARLRSRLAFAHDALPCHSSRYTQSDAYCPSNRFRSHSDMMLAATVDWRFRAVAHRTLQT